jgi:hypothetical protein
MSTQKRIAAADRKSARARVESFHARVNWGNHLVPVVRQAFDEFAAMLQQQGRKPPYFSLLSETLASGAEVSGLDGQLGDSITIQFGSRPLATSSLNSLTGRSTVQAENRAALVFSQAAASGAVSALMYPPASDVSRPVREFFHVDFYSNPRLLSRSRAVELLEDLWDVDSLCSTQNSPSKASGKVIAKLQAREEALQGTSNGFLRHFRYLYYLSKGLWKVFRAGHAAP